MDRFIEMLRNISPEVYQSLKQAVELGKWPDGRKLSREQKAMCLQAMIAWEADNLPEEQRTGYMGNAECASKSQSDPAAELYHPANGSLH